MKKLPVIRSFLITGFLMIAMTGCVLLAGGAVGAGTYAFVSGNLKTTYDAPLQQTWDATQKAVRSLEMKANKAEHDAFSGIFQGTMADGREFTISLKKVTGETTEVAIRIGMGDRKVSETIHGEILSNLK